MAEKDKVAKDKTYLTNAVGRRKTAVARVYLKNGKGSIVINERTLDQYFPYPIQQVTVKQPLAVLDVEGKYDILINVQGGGFNAQAEAIRHGISRAFGVLDETNRPVLKANGFLSRDSRMVERKKFGQRKARRRFQFSKR
ncbi:MAG: 30S ribosomal protein S9 [Spirochaetales bacterium]|nr:30S ribosomal protein S9 [Spirochaetales bacterium]